jgi:hypothetical protein
MRTKTLLIAAATLAAGLAISMAQAVYSQNVVGYVNVPLPASSTAGGFKIIANPLNGTNNTLATIIPNPPVGTKAYLYNNSTLLTVAVFGPDDDNNNNWGGDAGAVVAPGKAFWIQNPGAATNLTFVGEVPQGSLTNIVPAGFSLRSSIVPQGGQLDGVPPGLGYPAVVGSTIVSDTCLALAIPFPLVVLMMTTTRRGTRYLW